MTNSVQIPLLFGSWLFLLFAWVCSLSARKVKCLRCLFPYLKIIFCHICVLLKPKFHPVLGFLGSSDGISCHYSPPRYHNMLDLVSVPSTHKGQWKTLVTSSLQRFSLHYFTITWLEVTAVDEFCSQTWSYFAFCLLTFQFLAISRCLLSSGGKCELQWCLLARLHTMIPLEQLSPWIPVPFWDFQLHTEPWAHSPPRLEMGPAEHLMITFPLPSLQNTNCGTCGDRVFIKTLLW